MSAPARIGLVRSPLGEDAYRLWNRYEGDTLAESPIHYVRADIADEMLEALKRVHTIMDRTDWDLTYAGANGTIREEVQAAIAKAEGETE